jgi:hypothetical protein
MHIRHVFLIARRMAPPLASVLDLAATLAVWGSDSPLTSNYLHVSIVEVWGSFQFDRRGMHSCRVIPGRAGQSLILLLS